MSSAPLIGHATLDQVFAYRQGVAISAGQFLCDAAQLAQELPIAPHMLNLCVDRYHFCVGFAAALLRRQVSLLPPNQTPELIAQLKRDYPQVYCLTDTPQDYLSIQTLVVSLSRHRYSGQKPPAPLPSAQLAALIFTSGSTGAPVPHAKPWGRLVHGADVELARLGALGARGFSVLATVPPQHMYGLESSVVMVMRGGLALHSGRPFYPADICAELVALPRPRALVTTPVHLRALLALPGALPQADLVFCATALLAPELATEAEARFGGILHEIYGCTEAGQIATRRTVATKEWQLLPGLSFTTDDNGTWVGGGHVGAPILLNDVIEMRSTDRFLLHGRNADLVNIAGKRTSLAHLNYHLNAIQGVRDGLFVVPEVAGGEATRLIALVVAPGMTREMIKDALRTRIDAAFLPRPLWLVDALPRDATGKLSRQTLDRLIVEHASKGGG